MDKVEEKRGNFSLRKLRNPGEREREKYFASSFESSRTKREKTISLRKLRKPGEREKEKVVLLFSSILCREESRSSMGDEAVEVFCLWTLAATSICLYTGLYGKGWRGGRRGGDVNGVHAPGDLLV
jgi:hypothetical protein